MTDLENQETGRNFELPSKLSGLKDLKHIDGFQAPHLHQDETTTRCVPHYMRPSKLRATLLRAVTPQTHVMLRDQAAHFLDHWAKERIIMHHHSRLLILGIIWQYVHSVATNIAYYIHTPRTPLRDLGFLVFPPLSTDMQVLSEVFFFILVTITTMFAMSPFVKTVVRTPAAVVPSVHHRSRRNSRISRPPSPAVSTAAAGGGGGQAADLDSLSPLVDFSPDSLRSSFSQDSQTAPLLPAYHQHHGHQHLHPRQEEEEEMPQFTFLMLVRFTKVLVVTQTLRCIAFLSTSLPGPNYHCRPGAPDYLPPTGWFEIFARQDAFKGCGDLVFSSHTIFLVLCALVIHKYGKNQNLKRVIWALVGVFAMFCVAARKHYTLDIVVACYTVPLVWVMFEKLSPDELPPELVEILEQEKKLAAIQQDSAVERPHHRRTVSGSLGLVSSLSGGSNQTPQAVNWDVNVEGDVHPHH